MTVPLAPPAVVSMTLVVRLTLRSSWSRPNSSAQYSRVWLDCFFRIQPPGTKRKYLFYFAPKHRIHTFVNITGSPRAPAKLNVVYELKVFQPKACSFNLLSDLISFQKYVFVHNSLQASCKTSITLRSMFSGWKAPQDSGLIVSGEMEQASAVKGVIPSSEKENKSWCTSGKSRKNVRTPQLHFNEVFWVEGGRGVCVLCCVYVS